MGEGGRERRKGSFFGFAGENRALLFRIHGSAVCLCRTAQPPSPMRSSDARSRARAASSHVTKLKKEKQPRVISADEHNVNRHVSPNSNRCAGGNFVGSLSCIPVGDPQFDHLDQINGKAFARPSKTGRNRMLRKVTFWENLVLRAIICYGYMEDTARNESMGTSLIRCPSLGSSEDDNFHRHRTEFPPTANRATQSSNRTEASGHCP